MSVTSISRRFDQHFPGPFAYRAGRAGVDDTFDVFCRTTNAHLLSTYYWEERQRAQLEARIACLALSGSSIGCDTQRFESQLIAFRELYPAPYSARRDFCDYDGPSFDVFSKTNDETVFMLPDYIRRNGLVSRHLASALNQLLNRFDTSEAELGCKDTVGTSSPSPSTFRCTFWAASGSLSG